MDTDQGPDIVKGELEEAHSLSNTRPLPFLPNVRECCTGNGLTLPVSCRHLAVRFPGQITRGVTPRFVYPDLAAVIIRPSFSPGVVSPLCLVSLPSVGQPSLPGQFPICGSALSAWSVSHLLWVRLLCLVNLLVLLAQPFVFSLPSLKDLTCRFKKKKKKRLGLSVAPLTTTSHGPLSAWASVRMGWCQHGPVSACDKVSMDRCQDRPVLALDDVSTGRR